MSEKTVISEDDAPAIYEDPLDLMDEIERLKAKKDATILAHYYVDGEIQDIADFVGDSLKLARDAAQVETSTIVFSGVHFMAESAKILNPQKTVLIPDLLAGCSLAESCPPEKLAALPERASGRGARLCPQLPTLTHRQQSRVCVTGL